MRQMCHLTATETIPHRGSPSKLYCAVSLPDAGIDTIFYYHVTIKRSRNVKQFIMAKQVRCKHISHILP